ncbi:hypothetical protein D3C87_2044370 [compost metagenome]
MRKVHGCADALRKRLPRITVDHSRPRLHHGVAPKHDIDALGLLADIGMHALQVG